MSDLKTKLIVEKVFNQAKNGVVTIGDDQLGHWTFYTRFFNNINNKNNTTNSNYPTIKISDYPLFLNETTQYLNTAKKFYSRDQDYFDFSDESFPEKLFLDLIVNCTSSDFENIIPYIQNRTKMLETPVKTGRFDMGNFGDLNFVGIVTKRFSNLEGPYRFIPVFEDPATHTEFRLPTVTFGIVDDKATVFAMQNEDTNQTNPLAKKLDRYFRKVNKDVDPNDIIANVSPNAVVSLTLFVEYLKQHNITNITSPTLMPIRYNANLVSKFNRYKNSEEKKNAVWEHNRNQFNITNKLSYLMLRYAHHFNNSTADFDDVTQTMQLTVKPQTNYGDNVIYDIAKTIKFQTLQQADKNEKATRF